jgi:hypothetical protein
MTDIYANLKPKERRYHRDALRPEITAWRLALATFSIALPGLCIGVFQIRYGKPIIALAGTSILLLVISYVLSSSILSGFTETMQQGVRLKRKEPIRYWFDVGFLCLIYVLICAAFIGI